MIAFLAIPAFATATPRWGTPVPEPRVAPDEVVRLVRAADGTAARIRGKVPVPERVSGPPGVARNERGDAVAVWVVDTLPIAVYAASGGGPVERRLLDLESETGSRAPQVLINRAGDVLAGWNGKSGSFAVAMRTASGWGAPQVLSTPGRSVETWALELMEDGAAAAIWTESTSLQSAVMVARRDATTGVWTQAQLLESSRAGFSGLDVRLDAAGGSVGLWRTGDGDGAGNVRIAEFAAGSAGWSSPTTAGRVGRGGVAWLNVSPAGNAALAWVEDGTEGRAISVRVRPAGGGWGPAERLGSGPGEAFGPIVDIADTGHVVVGWTRIPEGALFPIPRAQVKLAGVGWTPARDLGSPSEGDNDFRFLSDVVIGADGRALALDETFSFDRSTTRITEFAEAAPRVTPAPVTYRAIDADAVSTGSLLWVRARLSRAVEHARLTLQERRAGRWSDVAARSVDGQTVAIALRANGTGNRTFRLRLRSSSGTILSRSVVVAVTRPRQRTIAVGREPLDLDRGGATLWVLSRDGRRRLLRPFDATTGRKRGRPFAAGAGAIAIAATREKVWVSDGRRVTPIDARSGRRGTPRRLSSDRTFAIVDIASDGTSAWALLARFEGLFSDEANATMLVKLDASGRVVRKITVPTVASGSEPTAIAVGAGSVWVTYEGFFGDGATVRLDLRTGQYSNVGPAVAVGRGTAWDLGDPIQRLVPDGGPSARPPLVEGGAGLPIPSVYFPIPLGPATVGADGVWAVSPSSSRLAVRRISRATAAVGPPIRVGLPAPSLPVGEVTVGPRIVDAPSGGAWVSVPELGAVVRVG